MYEATRLMVSGPESRRVLGELAKDPEAWSKVPRTEGDGEIHTGKLTS